ncbi:hypothetical protein VRU48_09600 [Pedobacter sp. KR3-3]|uniref:Anti-sigma factor NepR domain-containing protein n=1 Tax=Pedobacter albus TaxID=3113905 RepID=A0ABU7I7B2_9SPHI|nr:hypothetical protein [Pedobacter sp. KR3-3]MEE1945363.1 hypothetical protein [Pedobacter sp. KR3-3]
MTKTSTLNDLSNFSSPQPVEKAVDEGDQQNLLFYNSIRSKLDQLVKEPSDETIQKILDYSKKK